MFNLVGGGIGRRYVANETYLRQVFAAGCLNDGLSRMPSLDRRFELERKTMQGDYTSIAPNEAIGA